MADDKRSFVLLLAPLYCSVRDNNDTMFLAILRFYTNSMEWELTHG